MLLTELLDALDAAGITLRPTETELRFTPVEAMTPELLAELKEHKQQLLKLPAPTLLAQFRAAVANFNRAGEKEAELTARIDKGRDYCASNPSDKSAHTLLLELQLELAKVRRTLDWEALQQHDLEKMICQEAGLPGGYVCGVCASIVATGTCGCWKGEAA